jgi:hypothetical protein
MNDADFERMLTGGLARMAERAPAGPTAAEVLRTLRLRRSRRIAWFVSAASAAAAAAAVAALMLSAGTPVPASQPAPLPTAKVPDIIRKDEAPPKRPEPPEPIAPQPRLIPKPDAPAVELVRFEPLPPDVRTDVLRARLESVPMLTAGGRVVLRKQPDAPLVLLISGGPATGEAEAEAVADGLETLFAGFEEVRVTMEKGRVVSAILVRSRSGVTVRQTLTASPASRPKAGMARVVRMGV